MVGLWSLGERQTLDVYFVTLSILYPCPVPSATNKSIVAMV